MNVRKLSRPLRDGLRESLVWKGFYLHPTGKFLCSPVGEVVLPLLGKKKKPTISNGYYHCGDVSLHRIMCETFLKQMSPEKDMIINHLDGVKTNPAIFNLEWCDYIRNNNHAIDIGLRNDNIRIDVRNLESGEIRNYRSYSHAAKAIGVNPHIISSNIKRGLNKQYTIKDVYEVKPENDAWVLTKNHIGKNSEAGSKGVVVKKIGTDQYFLFSSAPAAGDYLAIKPHMFYSHLNGGTVNLKKNGYEAWYLADIDVPITEMVDMRVRRPKGFVPLRVQKMIEVLDCNTGVKTIYNTSQEFADRECVIKKTVQRAITEQGGKFRHYIVRYL